MANLYLGADGVAPVTGTSDVSVSLDLQPELKGAIAEVSGTSGNSFIFENYWLDERSAQDGEPVELYLFDKNNGESFWAYTSTDYNITYDGHEYKAALIKRGDIALDVNALKTQVELTADLSNPFARLFIAEPIEGTVKVTIYRRHFDSYIIHWKGYLRGIKFKSKTVAIILGLKINSLKRFGL